MLLGECVLLIRERGLFRLRAAELVDKLLQYRTIFFRDRLIFLIQLLVFVPRPKDRRHDNQEDKNDEPGDSLIECTVCKIKTERA